MSTDFRPVLYLKQYCPFCLKLRLFALEADVRDRLDIRSFAAGSDEESAIRAELEGKAEKISFPMAQLVPGQYMAESDQILAQLSAMFGKDLAELPVFIDYADGAFPQMIELYKANHALKAQLAEA